MFKTNEYFEGQVKSIAFIANGDPATIGVMAKGEYTFGTSSIEYMTITSGELWVKLPGEIEWKAYKPFEEFIVPKGVSFEVRCDSDTSYLCIYR
ncbi:MAG: pyrimidine/purine nucleoside phosphorylase [Bacteroidales bacterium]|nr:pyrimidine/purine nucleoside phosphorylase [Bacteroidales bacterium]